MNGGAIYNKDGTLNIKNSTFYNNAAFYGGIIYIDGGSLIADNTTFKYGYAKYDGGAIYIENGNFTANNCTFSNNNCYDSPLTYQNGNGIIYNEDQCFLTYCNFTGNQAVYGGVIYNKKDCTITNCSFSSNEADNNGGAIYNEDKCELEGCSFTNNQAGDNGGAIYNKDNTCTVSYSRFYKNTAESGLISNGDAIYCDKGTVKAQNNWWGSNSPDFDKLTHSWWIGASIDHSPYLKLSITSNPNITGIGAYSTITAYLIFNSDGDDTSSEGIVYNIPVTFAGDQFGSVSPTNTTINGTANTTFTGLKYGNSTVQAIVDDQKVSAQIQVISSADVSLLKNVNNTRPNVGDTVTFTVTARNNGTEDATNIQITDKMPGGFSNVVITPSIGNYNSTTGVWSISSLAGGQTATLTMSGTVTGTIAGMNVTNTAVKTHEDQYDPNPNNDQSSASIYVPVVNIQITKTVNYNCPNVGESVTFTIIVHNNGPDNASNIQIIDIMPFGFDNFTYTVSNGTYDNITGIWTISSLINGTNATLTLSGIVTPEIAGKLTTNNANITRVDQYNPNKNITANATIYVPIADLYLAKTVDKNNPNVGEIVTFTVTAINDGPDNATNIQITDIMPTGFNNVIIIPSVGTYFNGVWSVPLLKYGASATLTLSGIVTSEIAGKLTTNNANITHADQYDPMPDNNASASINTQEADIKITKTGDKIRANIGDHVIFTITATNDGPSQATGLIFIDKLPIGLDFNSASADIGIVTPYDHYILWDVGTLNNNQTATLTVNTTVNILKNMINIVRKIHEDQYDPSIDFATAIVYVLESDLSINNTPNQPKLNVGDTATFTVTARNNGPNKATNVIINDVIPQGFTAHVDKGEIINDIWYIGTLGRNEEATLTITGVISSNWAGKTIYNNLTETQDEYNCYPQTVSANIYIPLANVSITKVARPINFDLNETVRFLIILENHGVDDATSIKVVDTLPDGLDFVSASDNGIFDPISRTITWNIESLSNGTNKALILYTKVKETVSSNLITNTATESQNEYSNENKTSDATITINKSDLYLKSSSSNPNPEIGETFILTFKLGNKGPNTAKNVLITIPIPEGLEFITASVDQGTWTYDPSSRTIIWNVGDVKLGDPYIYVTLKALAQGHYVITPTVTTSTYDPNLLDSIISTNINVINSENTVNAASRTIGMQKTGLPIFALLFAILAVLTGLGYSGKK